MIEDKLSAVEVEDYVYKANCLSFFQEDVFTIPVLKLLDVIISKIDSRNPNNENIYVSKSEFERAVGIDRLRPGTAYNYAKSLSQPVSIRDPKDASRFVFMPLFSKSVADKTEDGRWYFIVSINPKAWDYFFGIERIGYMKYRLRNTTNLKSKHSFFLFSYLAKNTFRESWAVSIDSLLTELHCNNRYYKDFRHFKQLVLEPSIKEINEKTDIRVSYEKKTGNKNKTIGIRFTARALIGEEKVARDNAKEILAANKDRIERIKNLTGLDDNATIRIVDAMFANNLSDEETDRRIRYALKQPNVKNLCPYIVKLLNECVWSEPKETAVKKSSNQFHQYTQSTTDEDLEFFEKLFLFEVNKGEGNA